MGDDARPVLIGEAPSRGGDRYYHFPLSGRPAQVLCTLAGIDPVPDGSTYGRWTWALYDRFECVNLFERYAHATPWSAVSARERAKELVAGMEGRVVVALGRKVSKAVHEAQGWGEPSDDFHVWHRLDVGRGLEAFAAIPHPSGLNRLLNDPEERQRCGETLRRAIEQAAA